MISPTIMLVSLLVTTLLVSPIAQASSASTASSPLPTYPTIMTDTSDHPVPFYLRVMGSNTDYDGHNMQACDTSPTTSATTTHTAQATSTAHARRTPPHYAGCIDSSLSSPVLAFQLRKGSLYNRVFDDVTDSYVDGTMLGGLRNATSAREGTASEFDAQRMAFADPGHIAGDIFSVPSGMWALEVTGQYEGIGLYQLVNLFWDGKQSPAGAPWIVGWMLCDAGSGQSGPAMLSWYESAKDNPVPIPQNCELMQLQTDIPILGL